MLQNLKSFLFRGNVLDLAVGVIIGGAFNKIISALVEKLIMPLIGIIANGIDFSKAAITVGEANIGYGAVIQAVIDFIIVGIVLYFILKSAGIKPGAPAPTPSEALLMEIRDSLKK